MNDDTELTGKVLHEPCSEPGFQLVRVTGCGGGPARAQAIRGCDQTTGGQPGS